jgi:putative solute:sodium symporter small subunit
MNRRKQQVLRKLRRPARDSLAVLAIARPKRSPGARRNYRRHREDGLALKGRVRLMAVNDRVGYWNKTKNLMFVMLALWVFFGYVVHMFVTSLNNIVILGFPLGFYMAAQGSLIAFVVMLFWFARRQNAIDEEYGVAED